MGKREKKIWYYEKNDNIIPGKFYELSGILVLSMAACSNNRDDKENENKKITGDQEKMTEAQIATTQAQEEMTEAQIATTQAQEEMTGNQEETTVPQEETTVPQEETDESAGSAAEKATEAATADNADDEDAFYISKITDEIFERIKGKSFKDDCTLPRKDLRYLHVLHKDINGQVHEGEMIVNRHIAEDVLDILHELYKNDYPIEKIRLIDEYDADDETSMEDNNSSSFNFRYVSYSNKISKHGLGLAVDINTLYNPYTKVVDGERIIEPITGEPYLDRDATFDYKIEKGDLCYKLFTDHGFKWGGEWTNSKDYQHFEIPAEKIAQWYPDN